ncbi:muskelin [Leptidea sinapis]|uniref:muskelin n=1 Tax=Leptidea sinapis TaxID=189913 RepID=UPI0021C4AE9D|nr:muskelin [Leptidea sinapis]
MLFHPTQRRLYMFAGQRNKEQLLDIWWWDVDSGRCGAICPGVTPAPPPAATPLTPAPAAGFTQRATIDPDTDEIFVLSGMSKEKDRRVCNTLWALSLRRLAWTCVYRNDSVAPNHPRPRFAHQLVYDPHRKIHYLFGGNPGSAGSPRLRLDDLWSLRLQRPSSSGVVGVARAAIREACYRELAADPRLAPAALHYLRHDLHAATDHGDPLQVANFQKLATLLFSGEKSDERSPVSLSPRRTRTLAARRARAPLQADHVRVLAQVLGIDDSTPEPTQPFEECLPPTPDTWDVGHDAEDHTADPHWDSRQSRIQLYDRLAHYYKPSTVPPQGDIMDLVTL